MFFYLLTNQARPPFNNKNRHISFTFIEIKMFFFFSECEDFFIQNSITHFHETLSLKNSQTF